MNERELLVDCLRRLNRTGLTYYLTGSMASNFWGIPRTTHDLDFVLQLPMSVVPRIVEAFSGDFYIEEASVRAACRPPPQSRVGAKIGSENCLGLSAAGVVARSFRIPRIRASLAPRWTPKSRRNFPELIFVPTPNAIDTRSALKVDFWLPKPEPFDREMLRRRVEVTLFGQPAWIATAEDVVLHKLVWNRISPSERQLGDAAGIVAVQAEALDERYMRHWAGELGLVGEVERLLGGEIKPKNT